MINTWNESLLHEELKEYYRGEHGQKEVPINGSICDVLCEDGSIFEIQTAQLGKLKTKLTKLLMSHKINLVYPIPVNILIETYGNDYLLRTRRKSPKHGTIFQLFKELTGIYHLLDHENLTLTVVFADILEIRIADGTGSWRRKGIRLEDKKLLKIHHTREFHGINDYSSLIPETLPEFFMVTDLKKAGAGIYASYMAWVLKNAGIIEMTGKKGNARIYRKALK